MKAFRTYKLLDKQTILCKDDDELVDAWSWDRRVALDKVDEDIEVSTVFLVIDHNHFPKLNDGRPILFETMVFGGKYNEMCERCSTWDEAVKQHNVVLEFVKNNK
jgi:hypothetical protein